MHMDSMPAKLEPRGCHCMLRAHSNLHARPQDALRRCKLWTEHRSQLQVLDNVSGVLRPGRMTLLLGPPASGKSTLLQALAGALQLGPHLQVQFPLHHINVYGYRTHPQLAQRLACVMDPSFGTAMQ